MMKNLLPINMALVSGIPIEGFDADGPLGLIWYSGAHKRWFAVEPGKTDPRDPIDPTHCLPPHFLTNGAIVLLDFIRGHRRGTA